MYAWLILLKKTLKLELGKGVVMSLLHVFVCIRIDYNQSCAPKSNWKENNYSHLYTEAPDHEGSCRGAKMLNSIFWLEMQYKSCVSLHVDLAEHVQND